MTTSNTSASKCAHIIAPDRFRVLDQSTQEVMEKPLRTDIENEVGPGIARIFDTSPDSTEVKLENFTKYVRRNHLKRFLAMYEVFKRAMPVKGSVIECGVYKGFGLMAWAKLSAMLEPENLTRRIYGFDTFEGFPSLQDHDVSPATTAKPGDLKADSYAELLELVAEYDRDRSVIECGVYKGFGLMAWAKLSAMLEPENLTRRIYGFDTFEGFPSLQD